MCVRCQEFIALQQLILPSILYLETYYKTTWLFRPPLGGKGLPSFVASRYSIRCPPGQQPLKAANIGNMDHGSRQRVPDTQSHKSRAKQQCRRAPHSPTALSAVELLVARAGSTLCKRKQSAHARMSVPMRTTMQNTQDRNIYVDLAAPDRNAKLQHAHQFKPLSKNAFEQRECDPN